MAALKKILITFATAVLFILYGCGLYYYDYHDDSAKDRSGNLYKDDGLTVKEVLDGDTVVLSDDRRVRLIGINTPERGMYFFDEAREVLEVMVLDKEVILERDVSEEDIYGRLLRYVFVGELFVNLEMVERGFANVYTCPPDVKYTEKFLDAERAARSNDLGLWQESKIDLVKIDLKYDAAGDDSLNLNDEYIVIRNTGDDPVNICSWTVKDSATNIYEFGSYILKSDSAVCLFSGSGRDGEGRFYWGSPKPVWNNDHDTLYLRDREGLLIEIYDY
jgi:endonuclease YncB( thermonuclease family)